MAKVFLRRNVENQEPPAKKEFGKVNSGLPERDRIVEELEEVLPAGDDVMEDKNYEKIEDPDLVVNEILEGRDEKISIGSLEGFKYWMKLTGEVMRKKDTSAVMKAMVVSALWAAYAFTVMSESVSGAVERLNRKYSPGEVIERYRNEGPEEMI